MGSSVSTEVPLVLAELDPASRVLPGYEGDHPAQPFIGHEGLDRVVALLKVLVGEDLVNGAVAISTKGQGVLSTPALRDEVVIRGVQVGSFAKGAGLRAHLRRFLAISVRMTMPAHL
jgi:hypothetical protein